MATDPISHLSEAEIRNGIETAKRVEELVESVKVGPDAFALETAKSLGKIEGTSAFISDMIQKQITPTLIRHERSINTNKWWIRGTMLMCIAIVAVMSYLGQRLFCLLLELAKLN